MMARQFDVTRRERTKLVGSGASVAEEERGEAAIRNPFNFSPGSTKRDGSDNFSRSVAIDDGSTASTTTVYEVGRERQMDRLSVECLPKNKNQTDVYSASSGSHHKIILEVINHFEMLCVCFMHRSYEMKFHSWTFRASWCQPGHHCILKMSGCLCLHPLFAAGGGGEGKTPQNCYNRHHRRKRPFRLKKIPASSFPVHSYTTPCLRPLFLLRTSRSYKEVFRVVYRDVYFSKCFSFPLPTARIWIVL